MTVSFLTATDVKESQTAQESNGNDAFTTPRVISVIMRRALEAGATAIHIETRGKETHVRYRVDGILRTLLTLPGYLHSSLAARIKLLSAMRLDEVRMPQHGQMTHAIDGEAVDFYVSTLPVFDQEKIVLRRRDASMSASGFVELGFRDRERALIAQKLKKAQGIILITGPIGSGKSTTARALLGATRYTGASLATLEDPLSAFLPGVSQAQIRPEVGFDFASGLRALLRQDARVIMVEELPDLETSTLAVHAALTGHLVVTAVHADDAAEALTRLMQLGIEPFLLSSALGAVVSQRLVRKICQHCSTEADVSERLQRVLRESLAEIPASYYPPGVTADGPLSFRKGAGCARCNDTGYLGRTVVAELTRITPEVEELMQRRCSIDRLRAALKRQAWLTLEQDAIIKALEGVTTVDEALRFL